jgi:predicted RNA-binding protein with RPS1 domain
VVCCTVKKVTSYGAFVEVNFPQKIVNLTSW